MRAHRRVPSYIALLTTDNGEVGGFGPSGQKPAAVIDSILSAFATNGGHTTAILWITHLL